MNDSRMRAVVVSPEGPRLATAPIPKPGPHQVLVQVKHATLNRADLHVAAGHKHGKSGGEGAVIGIEWAGIIAEIGSEVPGLCVGDRVMCSGAGAYADFAVTDWGRVYKIPDSMSLQEAATLPIALQTAYEALTVSGGFSAGEAVLVQGGSSAVGLMTLQISNLLGASLIVATSTTSERRGRLKEFGASVAVDSSDPNWPQHVLDATGGEGCDLVVDFVAGPMMNGNMRSAKVTGRIVNVGRMGGFNGEFDFDLHSLRRIKYIGVTFRTRSLEEVRAISAGVRRHLWAALEQGKLKLPIARNFPLEEAAIALRHTSTNSHFGKVVLDLA